MELMNTESPFAFEITPIGARQRYFQKVKMKGEVFLIRGVS